MCVFVGCPEQYSTSKSTFLDQFYRMPWLRHQLFCMFQKRTGSLALKTGVVGKDEIMQVYSLGRGLLSYLSLRNR